MESIEFAVIITLILFVVFLGFTMFELTYTYCRYLESKLDLQRPTYEVREYKLSAATKINDANVTVPAVRPADGAITAPETTAGSRPAVR